eukprot:Selendium_serpulae@DN11554_c0_g1_i1.p1
MSVARFVAHRVCGVPPFGFATRSMCSAVQSVRYHARLNDVAPRRLNTRLPRIAFLPTTQGTVAQQPRLLPPWSWRYPRSCLARPATTFATEGRGACPMNNPIKRTTVFPHFCPTKMNGHMSMEKLG